MMKQINSIITNTMDAWSRETQSLGQLGKLWQRNLLIRFEEINLKKFDEVETNHTEVQTKKVLKTFWYMRNVMWLKHTAKRIERDSIGWRNK